MEDSMFKEESISDENEEICPYCGNIYKVIWLKEGDDYNDFGYRHCPFCGMLIDEYAHIGRFARK